VSPDKLTSGSRAPRVLLFDSGVGGLSIARCIHQQLPGVHLVYLADNACFPYGDQPEEVVIRRCLELTAAALEAWPSDLVVVACNTASTVVLPHLRAMTTVPVVGVVPAIKPAAQLSRNRRIGLLATPATIRRPYLDQLVREFAADCELTRLGDPRLVRWIESWVAGEPLPADALDAMLAPFRHAGVDTVVLGCTHYPLIGEVLQQCLPEVLSWVDSGEAIARRTAHLLAQQGCPVESLLPLAQPVDAALFSGTVPAGLSSFLSGLGLTAARIHGHWPVAASRCATATGSA